VRFVNTFGHDRVRLTRTNLIVAAQAGLDLGWLAMQLPLTRQQRRRLRPLNLYWWQSYTIMATVRQVLREGGADDRLVPNHCRSRVESLLLAYQLADVLTLP
jgi:hypothetical protein